MNQPMNIPAPSPWHRPTDSLILGNDEVHVWRASLDRSPSQVDGLLDTLAPDEQARAGQFYFPIDRDRFIVARGTLRELLGRYLNRPARAVSFQYGTHAKPALAFESESALRFNISHSQDTAIYAVTRGREIGIDLEFIRDDVEIADIARRFFSGHEVAMLQALPVGLQKSAFFLCWTRKEAYIKARGEGLSLPLDQFDVSLIPGEPAALLRTQGDPDEARRWSLRELNIGPNYASALAVEGYGWSVSCWEWPPLIRNSAPMP